MKLGVVIGSLWATRKDERLSPYKLLIVQPINLVKETGEGGPIVAVDTIGAGAGERVLLVQGSSARNAAGRGEPPVDATVVGIVDDRELDGNVLSTLEGA